VDTCDVLIVGGGPAGSSCAWALRRAGLDAVVVDRARFPRDKVCAGWITPQVVEELEIDTRDYERGRVLQPIKSFIAGMGERTGKPVHYDKIVSYGIRRCEFDAYLLRRSGARLLLGGAASTIVRDHGSWIVNDRVRAPMLVGAGGHFCPIARSMNPVSAGLDRGRVVVAQEAEFEADPDDEAASPSAGDTPELYFCRELDGYGWRVRKGSHVNVGIGRLDCRALPRTVTKFGAFLERSGRARSIARRRWRGHAYLVSTTRRRAVDDGVLLVGDAAGLAWPQSGEGIRPAVQSGLFAARTIAAAAGRYARDRLQRYDTWLGTTFRAGSPVMSALSPFVPAAVWMPLARSLLGNAAFVRSIVLDRGFLRS
jgi:menaquinone-9 beta-reductase